MNALALLALLFFAGKKPAGGSAALPSGGRKKVIGKHSGETWWTFTQAQQVGTDATRMQSTQVYASEKGQDLVIAFVRIPDDALVYWSDGGSPVKSDDLHVLFYAAPSTLTAKAQSDFLSL